MINTIIRLLRMGDLLTTILSFSFFIGFIVLIVVYNKVKNNDKKLKLWKIACLIPLVISLVHFCVFTIGSAILHIPPYYLPIYIPSVLIAFLPLLIKKKLLYKIGSLLITVICLAFVVVSIYPNKVANYTTKSLSDAYVSLCDYLEENYVLSQWKKIDYEKLKSDGLVLVKQAEKTGDTNKYYEALNNLVDSFHDGHVGLMFYNTDYNYNVEKIKEFNDYGLSLITLDDGSTIAVNVEDGLDIKNGDTVVKWDGVPVKEAIDNVVLPITEGTLENERIQKTFYLAGVGGDTVKVTYINSDNKEITTTLKKLDSNLPRALNSMGILNHSKNEEYTYKMLNDNVGYLRITSEETDEFSDNLAYFTGDHSVAREMFRKDLRTLKEQGMTKLVIDIRNNGGGYEEVSTALASLFTKEKMYAFSLGVKNGNELKSVEDRYVIADGEFSDLEIVTLTGMRCGSAGDGMSLYLSRLDNVTVAGVTNPSGINQDVGGYVYMPENALIAFPIGPILDKDGNPNIDIDDTRESRNPVDIKIPLNKESALKIFSGEDYELEWAVNYLNNKS